jgi:hypothetical protein
MAKRRHFGSEEMLMVPFLDILCSLIGVLVLIIVFLVVSQTSQTEGRTQEEIERATKFKKLKQNQEQNIAREAEVKPLLEKLESLEEKSKEAEVKVVKLRMLISKETESKNINENLAKLLDNLLLEIKGYELQMLDLKKELASLMEELKKRKIIANTVPPVKVQPSGDVVEPGTKFYFIEASGGKIVLYWSNQEQTQVNSAPEIIIADPAYEAFLKKVKEIPKSKIIFLVRDDGLGSYRNAAGWAQQTYAYEANQIAKLPIPGRGSIDLSMFNSLMGSIPVPQGIPLSSKPQP